MDERKSGRMLAIATIVGLILLFILFPWVVPMLIAIVGGLICLIFLIVVLVVMVVFIMGVLAVPYYFFKNPPVVQQYNKYRVEDISHPYGDTPNTDEESQDDPSSYSPP